jgi:hypothetical protein
MCVCFEQQAGCVACQRHCVMSVCVCVTKTPLTLFTHVRCVPPPARRRLIWGLATARVHPGDGWLLSFCKAAQAKFMEANGSQLTTVVYGACGPLGLPCECAGAAAACGQVLTMCAGDACARARVCVCVLCRGGAAAVRPARRVGGGLAGGCPAAAANPERTQPGKRCVGAGGVQVREHSAHVPAEHTLWQLGAMQSLLTSPCHASLPAGA